MHSFSSQKGISPIIATLLLILIAIAAGVIVYAYVIGFVGASTSNSGATSNTLTMDQLNLNHATTAFPVTAYVRNLGPSTESFNTGFALKSSSFNDPLGPAVQILVTLGGTTPVPTVQYVEINYTSATTITVSVVLSACTGTTPTIALTVTALGSTSGAGTVASTACSATKYTTNAFTISPGVSSGFEAQTTSLSSTLVTATTYIFGTSVLAGTLTTNINSVSTLTLAPITTTSNFNTNPLTSGSTYSVQVTGTDGGTAVASAKSL